MHKVICGHIALLMMLCCQLRAADIDAILTEGQGLESTFAYRDAVKLYEQSFHVATDNEEKLKLYRALVMATWLHADGRQSLMDVPVGHARQLVKFTHEDFGSNSKAHIDAQILLANICFDAGKVNECASASRTAEALSGVFRQSDPQYYIRIIEQSAYRRSLYEDRQNVVSSLLALNEVYISVYGEHSDEYLRHLLRIAKHYVFLPQQVQIGKQLCQVVQRQIQAETFDGDMHEFEALRILAHLHVVAHELEEAEALHQRILALLKKDGTAYQLLRYGHSDLVEFYIQTKQMEKARAALAQAEAAMQSLPDSNPFERGSLLKTRLLFQIADEKNMHLQQDLAACADRMPGEVGDAKNARLAIFYVMIVKESERLGIERRVLPVIEEAVGIMQQAQRPFGSELIELFDMQARILRNLGRIDEAKRAELDAQELRK